MGRDRNRLGDKDKLFALLSRLPRGWGVVRIPGVFWDYWQVENEHGQVLATGDELVGVLEAARMVLDGEVREQKIEVGS